MCVPRASAAEGGESVYTSSFFSPFSPRSFRGPPDPQSVSDSVLDGVSPKSEGREIPICARMNSSSPHCVLNLTLSRLCLEAGEAMGCQDGGGGGAMEEALKFRWRSIHPLKLPRDFFNKKKKILSSSSAEKAFRLMPLVEGIPQVALNLVVLASVAAILRCCPMQKFRSISFSVQHQREMFKGTITLIL